MRSIKDYLALQISDKYGYPNWKYQGESLLQEPIGV